MTASNRQESVAYYSVLRYVPDPLRDEAINVGLLMVGADGWTRVRARVPRTRLRAANRLQDAEAVEAWVDAISERFDAHGMEGLFTPDNKLSAETLTSWARDFGGALRLSQPRAAVYTDPDELWTLVYRRLVGPHARDEFEQALEAPPRRLSARRERELVVRAMVDVFEGWPTFDRSRLVFHETVPGRRASHVADLAILNGRVKAIAQALPLGHGTDAEIITSRALLLDAAIDLEADVLKLGVYQDPPAERLEILQQTRSVLQEANTRDMSVELRSVAGLQELEGEFALRLFGDV